MPLLPNNDSTVNEGTTIPDNKQRNVRRETNELYFNDNSLDAKRKSESE